MHSFKIRRVRIKFQEGVLEKPPGVPRFLKNASKQNFWHFYDKRYYFQVTINRKLS